MNKRKFDFWMGIVMMTIIVGCLLAFCWYWAGRTDAMVKQIWEDEARAAFRAQVLRTDNGARIFVWEKDGQVFGKVISEEY